MLCCVRVRVRVRVRVLVSSVHNAPAAALESLLTAFCRARVRLSSVFRDSQLVAPSNLRASAALELKPTVIRTELASEFRL